MNKTYDPQAVEASYQEAITAAQYCNPSDQGDPYCIVLPPPNITGSLHMGHGFQTTLMDILIRFQRMNGRSTLWQPGTDHAGIATQMVVQRMLAAQGIEVSQLERSAFLDHVWQWKDKAQQRIAKQLKRLGTSLAWDREKFTLDPTLSHAVYQVFVRLYREGFIYKGPGLVNWDPLLLTAISDLEVISREEQGQLYYIHYRLTTGNGSIIVATTRPETLFGDVAVAVNPNDERYNKLIGQEVHLPLSTRVIPIIADTYVDPEFGTGCLKITPAHDFNDYQIALRHHLTPLNIFTTNACLNASVPPIYRGLERQLARTTVIQDLQNQQLIEKVVPHMMAIPYSEKSGAIVEPYLTEQWFVKMKDLADPARDAVLKGDISFVPHNWTKTYLHWLDNIQDWCISRQLWWGHRLPVWYDNDNNIYVATNEAEVRAHYGLSNDLALRQDEDVLDTWFSAALWPFASLGWPNYTDTDVQKFFPTQVLVTGFDIIFFWVARMIMLSLKFTDQVPFSEIYITGLILDQDGQKMSKSKGNVLDPLDLIEGIDLEALTAKRTQGLMQPKMAPNIIAQTKQQFPEGIKPYGADALRLTFAALATHAKAINFDFSKLSNYRNFCNKLWHTARFVLLHTSNIPVQHTPSIALPSEPCSRWIMVLLNDTIQRVHTYLHEYRFDLSVQSIYDFTWNELCDWYLEIAKIYLSNEHTDEQVQASIKTTLLKVMATLITLLHPIAPFITTAIWDELKPLLGITTPLMLAPFPHYDPKQHDTAIVTELTWVKTIVTTIRNMRNTASIPPGEWLPLTIHYHNDDYHKLGHKYLELITKLARLSEITWISRPKAPAGTLTETSLDAAPNTFSTAIAEVVLQIPNTVLSNIPDQLLSLAQKLAKLTKEHERLTAQLSNSQFIERAPAAIVTTAKERLNTLTDQIAHHQAHYAQLQKSV